MNRWRAFDRDVGRWVEEGAQVIAMALLVCAALVCLAFQATALGYRYELDYGEAPLVDQAVRLAAGETIYQPDLTVPPYTISNYPPGYIAD